MFKLMNCDDFLLTNGRLFCSSRYMALTVGLPTYFGKAHFGKISGL